MTAAEIQVYLSDAYADLAEAMDDLFLDIEEAQIDRRLATFA